MASVVFYSVTTFWGWGVFVWISIPTAAPGLLTIARGVGYGWVCRVADSALFVRESLTDRIRSCLFLDNHAMLC